MKDNFDKAWVDIRQRLRPNTMIKNWSADRGYTGGEFLVNDVDGAAVIVRSGQMGQERRVSKGDFQRLFAFWDAYNRGTISRAELGKRSQNTTYILSILHWREETQGSMAPSPRVSLAPMPPPPEPVSAATRLAGHDAYGKRV
jgi:hypothetical protein